MIAEYTGSRANGPESVVAEHVTAEAMNRVLALGRGIFPYVVVDLDHSFRDEQAQVLKQANVILLVMRLDFASLRNAQRTPWRGSLDPLSHANYPRWWPLANVFGAGLLFVSPLERARCVSPATLFT